MSDMFELLEREKPTVAAVVTEPVYDLVRADVIEIRADIFTEMQNRGQLRGEIVNTALGNIDGLLFTLRDQSEGGKWTGTDDERFEIIRGLIDVVDGVDVELASAGLIKQVVGLVKERNLNTAVIGSFHDLEGTPELDNLEDIIYDGTGLDVDFVKIATRLNSAEDLRALANLTSRYLEDGSLITVGMGIEDDPFTVKLAEESRKILSLLGSRMTYGSIGRAVVSGQLSVEELNTYFGQLYR